MPDVVLRPSSVVFESIRHARARVTVAITLYNYVDVIVDALDSVASQDLDDVDLVIVNDCSTDESEQRALDWLRAHDERFGRSVLVRHVQNAGLAAARNQSFALAASPYVFVLDADNQLYPRCLSTCLQAADSTGADAVYTLLEVFGDEVGVMGTNLWNPAAFSVENYVDAMALIRRSAWRQVGGYRHMPANGWEDYDLWMKFCEAGLEALRVPEILCRYRKLSTSMLRSVTNRQATIEMLRDDMRVHHPTLTANWRTG